MDLKHLEQIVAISRHGGFSGAARRLGMAQSTLSKNIARLEAKLGVELFAREAGAAQPTSYGRFLVARAEAVLCDVEALNHDFDKLVHGERGRLRIGVGPAPLHGLLGPNRHGHGSALSGAVAAHRPGQRPAAGQRPGRGRL